MFCVINLKAQYEACSCNIDHGRWQRFWRLIEVNDTLLLCCKLIGLSFISFSYLLFNISKYLMLFFSFTTKAFVIFHCHFLLLKCTRVYCYLFLYEHPRQVQGKCSNPLGLFSLFFKGVFLLIFHGRHWVLWFWKVY